MNVFDSHCHLNFDAFDADRSEVISRCQLAGISGILIPAAEKADWESIDTLCKKYPTYLFPAVGLHPVFIDKHQQSDLTRLEDFIQNHTVKAIGEIGLDFFIKSLDKQKQLHFFTEQLKIAEKNQLPVIMHVRKAHDEVISALKNTSVAKGIVHAFNGSIQQAELYMDMGFMLGFGGTMTYDNANHIHKLAKTIPLDHIVLETDAPDMVVAEHKGERNSPEYVTYSLQALSKLRNQPDDVIASITTDNARRILNLE